MMCDRNTPTKFRLSLDLHENRSHDSLQTAPTSCPELDEVQHDLSLYGCGKIIVLNDFCVLFAVPPPTNVVVGNSTDGGALYCLIGGRQATRTFSEMVDNRRTILTLPSILSAVCIAQN